MALVKAKGRVPASTVTRPANLKHPHFTTRPAAANSGVSHQALKAAGISSVPLKRSSDEKERKRAARPWAAFIKQLPTDAQAQGWDQEQARGSVEGVGVICGSVSRLEDIDHDDTTCPAPWRQMVEAAAPGLLDRLYQQTTPSGGLHVVYRYDGPIDGNQKLAVSESGDVRIETRGEGGYFATAKDGYEHISGPALTELEPITADERELLLSISRSFDLKSAEDHQEPEVPGYAKGKRPGDDFNIRASWEDVLLPHGWTKGREPDSWTRPGKSDGRTSASTAKKSKAGVDLLRVFSTSADPLKCKSYSKFEAYSALNHGDDYKAAAKALHKQGYVERSASRNGHIGSGPVSEDGKSLANCNVDGVPFQPNQMAEAYRAATRDWPRVVKSGSERVLFFNLHGDAITTVENPAQLERVSRNIFERVDFKGRSDLPKMEHLFEEFRAADSGTTAYLGIETMPHFPTDLPGYYYVYEESLEGGDGVAWEGLLDYFHMATPVDRSLLKAACATTFWNGPGGTRPAFLFASDFHWGSGKSTPVKIFSLLLNQPELALQAHGKIEELTTRMLSPEGMRKRLCLLDNVKTSNFSWAGYEALLTSRVLSGRKLYVGEGDRPNYFTHFITLNSPELSTDMAQRVVPIKMGNLDGDDEAAADTAADTAAGADGGADGGGGSRLPSKRSTAWERSVYDYVEKNRMAIVNDIGAFLRGPKVTITNPSRWATWEGEVLACLPDANELLAVIRERRQDYDSNARDAAELEEFFVKQVRRYGFHPDREQVNVSIPVANSWVEDVLKGNREPARKLIKRWQRHLRLLKINPSNKVPDHGIIVGNTGPVTYELSKKMSVRR